MHAHYFPGRWKAKQKQQQKWLVFTGEILCFSTSTLTFNTCFAGFVRVHTIYSYDIIYLFIFWNKFVCVCLYDFEMWKWNVMFSFIRFVSAHVGATCLWMHSFFSKRSCLGLLRDSFCASPTMAVDIYFRRAECLGPFFPRPGSFQSGQVVQSCVCTPHLRSECRHKKPLRTQYVSPWKHMRFSWVFWKRKPGKKAQYLELYVDVFL